MQVITNKIVADELSAYLRHELTPADLVDWAETVMMNGDFDDENYDMLRDIVSKLGVSDVKAFGLTWEDCEQFLNQLGYKTHVEVVAL